MVTELLLILSTALIGSYAFVRGVLVFAGFSDGYTGLFLLAGSMPGNEGGISSMGMLVI